MVKAGEIGLIQMGLMLLTPLIFMELYGQLQIHAFI